MTLATNKIIKQLEKEKEVNRCLCDDCATSISFLKAAMNRQAKAIFDEIDTKGGHYSLDLKEKWCDTK